MVLTSKGELFFSNLPIAYIVFFFSFSSSSQSIDTCIQTRRASAIRLVKLDLCWTHMVQHTFEMMGSHLFLPFSLSLSLSLFLLYFVFFSRSYSLFLLRFTSCYFAEFNPPIANVTIISNTSIIQIILKRHCLT